jgi:molybdate transport system substrate-binding protein
MLVALIGAACVTGLVAEAHAEDMLVIATSPTVKDAIEELGRVFESTHPNVRVRVAVDMALDLRRTIAAVENRGSFFIGSGPIHLVAPGDDELITRLEQKRYVLPGTRRPYAALPLVMVVPESLVDAPISLESLSHDRAVRVAIADPTLSTLGAKSRELLMATGVWSALQGRLYMASDGRNVLDHLLNGEADVGIIYGPEAVRESQRVRIVIFSSHVAVPLTVHSLAMERFCPNRSLCEEFLAFSQSSEAQAALKLLGYASPLSASRGDPQ